MTEYDSSAHREMRELLGAYALGGLSKDAHAAVRAHVDGCPACRGELAEIAPLADALRLVDPDALSVVPVPPPDLGDRIVDRVLAERGLTQARARAVERRAAVHRRSSPRCAGGWLHAATPGPERRRPGAGRSASAAGDPAPRPRWRCGVRLRSRPGPRRWPGARGGSRST